MNNFHSDSYGNRTRVTAVKGRCLDRLTKEPNVLLRTLQKMSYIFMKFTSELLLLDSNQRHPD